MRSQKQLPNERMSSAVHAGGRQSSGGRKSALGPPPCGLLRVYTAQEKDQHEGAKSLHWTPPCAETLSHSLARRPPLWEPRPQSVKGGGDTSSGPSGALGQHVLTEHRRHRSQSTHCSSPPPAPCQASLSASARPLKSCGPGVASHPTAHGPGHVCGSTGARACGHASTANRSAACLAQLDSPTMATPALNLFPARRRVHPPPSLMGMGWTEFTTLS